MYRIIKVINGNDGLRWYELQEAYKTIEGLPCKYAYHTIFGAKDYKECYQQYLKRINPIKDNRIISDQTFATRLLSFLDRTDVVYQSSLEEKEYLMRIAKDLLDYQKKTANTKEEKDYLQRTCTK